MEHSKQMLSLYRKFIEWNCWCTRCHHKIMQRNCVSFMTCFCIWWNMIFGCRECDRQKNSVICQIHMMFFASNFMLIWINFDEKHSSESESESVFRLYDFDFIEKNVSYYNLNKLPGKWSSIWEKKRMWSNALSKNDGQDPLFLFNCLSDFVLLLALEMLYTHFFWFWHKAFAFFTYANFQQRMQTDTKITKSLAND